MKLAMLAADYTPGEADQLRRDMAAWRQHGRIEQHHDRLVSRMENRGISREFAEKVFDQIRGFGEYGFPESHAASFALIAYCTAWLRCRYPEAFVCALLNAWPMGFYTPSTIVEDARRHGIEIRPVCILKSRWDCTLESVEATNRDKNGAGFAVRIGLRFVRGLGRGEYDQIESARAAGQIPESSPESRSGELRRFLQAAGLSREIRECLAVSGAFAVFETSRRAALWDAVERSDKEPVGPRGPGGDSDEDPGRVTGERSPDERPGGDTVISLLRRYEIRPEFEGLSGFEEITWDYGALGHSTAGHPIERWREDFRLRGFPDAATVMRMQNGRAIRYAGMVICRQRPATAGGTVFFTLEDETGLLNLILKKQVFETYRVVLLTRSLLGVEGTLQHQNDVIHLMVRSCFDPLSTDSPATGVRSRDFQ